MNGNAGIADVATTVAGNANNPADVVAFCQKNTIDFVVVGGETPLVAGVVDALTASDIKAFGCNQLAAQLEGSKGFMKDLCAKYGIPTAAYQRFTMVEPALAYLQTLPLPLVIKADGLAAGKGVIIAESYPEGEAAVHTLLEEQGAIVIEEFMDGEEVSFFALTDGITAIPFGTAQDHKRVFDGDKGANTGGMGAYSPAPLENPAFTQQIMDSIIIPTVNALNAEGITYQGVLYAGLMVTKDGAKLLEYNARFGDPECEVLMLRLQTDIVEIMLSVAEQRLAALPTPQWDDAPALCVVMASKGYPAQFQKGTVIRGVDALSTPSYQPTKISEGSSSEPRLNGVGLTPMTAADGVAQAAFGNLSGLVSDTVVFHAGTARDENGNLTAIGGRVLVVSSKAATLRQAQQNAYKVVDAIQWENGFCRRDIGWRALGV